MFTLGNHGHATVIDRQKGECLLIALFFIALIFTVLACHRPPGEAFPPSVVCRYQSRNGAEIEHGHLRGLCVQVVASPTSRLLLLPAPRLLVACSCLSAQTDGPNR